MSKNKNISKIPKIFSPSIQKLVMRSVTALMSDSISSIINNLTFPETLINPLYLSLPLRK
jgi:hypothetical protein